MIISYNIQMGTLTQFWSLIICMNSLIRLLLSFHNDCWLQNNCSNLGTDLFEIRKDIALVINKTYCLKIRYFALHPRKKTRITYIFFYFCQLIDLLLQTVYNVLSNKISCTCSIMGMNLNTNLWPILLLLSTNRTCKHCIIMLNIY